MKQKRLQLLLALLMTAATGAWAQDAENLKVYYNALNDWDLFDEMTKIDANGDGTNEMNGCWVLGDYATYNCSPQNKDADDWLVTPGLVLEAGVTYTIALEARKPSPQNHTYTETFEVKVGTDATAEALSAGTQVIKTTEVTTSWTNYRRTFTPTTSGTYYVGIHATSPKDQNSFSIRNLVVGLNYYTLSLADNTKDAGNWKGNVNNAETDVNLPITKLDGGEKVTLKYGGRLKVKAVTATHDGWNGDLSNIPASLIQDDDLTVIVPDGTTLKGTLDVSTIPYKIVIPAGATVTLAGVTIDGTNVNDVAHKHAGITCEGNATIILKDNSENTVKGFFENYPGIYVPEESTLIIQGGSDGNGKLTASSNGFGAGIGAGYVPLSCGDIEIQGGDITATGGKYSAGIGGGFSSKCDNITISGGTVTANGGQDGAGIGSGNQYGANCVAITISGGTVKATGGHNGAGIGSGNGVSCGNITISGGTVEATATYNAAGIGSGLNGTSGNITITDGVTLVTATKGEYAPYSIGEGTTNQLGTSTCGTVTIGGMVYWQNNYAVDDGATYLAQPTFKFVNLSKLTADYVAQDGDVLTNATTTHKVSIAAGATVTLAGVYISGDSYCIRCLGDATIVLKDGMANTLTSESEVYPALWAGDEYTTLTIKGSTGVLNVKSGNNCAGIGGGYMNTSKTCGNITIEGGVITAQGGSCAPGIGSDKGGAVKCGNITITNGVTRVTAKKGGEEAPYSIGASDTGSCGTIIIGCTLDSDGNPVGGTKYWEDNAAVGEAADNYLRQATIIYPEP